MDMGADVGMGLGFKGLRVAWDISSYALSATGQDGTDPCKFFDNADKWA